jgi:hypothetical protein
VIIFGSVLFLSKKVTKTGFKKKQKPNRTSSNRPVLVRFGYFRKKPVQTGLARFSVWLGFFSVFFGLGSVWFFRFQAYKTETEPNWSAFSKF